MAVRGCFGVLVSLYLCWASTTLVLVLSARDDFINPVPPSLGDIALLPWRDSDPNTTGRVAIFFTDGVNQSRWGTVCANKRNTRLAQVVCRQLGFSDGSYHLARNAIFEENYGTWIHSVGCSDEEGVFPQNLLRCSYKLYKEDVPNCGHELDLVVECSGERTTSTAQRYQGQVWLCPPDQARAGPLHQISMGLAAVYYHQDWGAINEKSSVTGFGTFDANSFCRQLGYTQAVPDSTLTVEGARPHYNYSICQDSFAKQSWFRSEEISKCNSSAARCFGCCHDYPSTSYGCPDCDNKDAITLACMFDPYNDANPTSGNEEMCKFDSSNKLPKGVCKDETSPSTLEIEIFSPIVAVLLAGVVVLAFILVVLGYRSWRRRHYRPLPDQNGGPAPVGQQ